MKVVIVSVFPPFRGGIARFNSHLAAALKAGGHDVFEINFSRQYPSFLFPGKTQYIDGSTHSSIPALLDSINPISWRKTARYVEELNPDRVIIPYWSGYLAPALRGVARRLRQHRVTGLLHNAIPHDAGVVQKQLSLLFFTSCDDFVTLSRSVTDDFKALIEHDESSKNVRVTTLFHPVYPHSNTSVQRDQARAQFGLSAGCKVLLFFGLIRKYKGLDLLLRAFMELDDSYHLIIAGEAYISLDEMKAGIPETHFSRVHWHSDFIADEDLPLYFGAADLLVLPYRNATQSGVTATALHFNLPIVASNVGGLSEYIDHGVTGLLFEPNDADAIKAAIIEWFASGREAEIIESRIGEKRNALSWESFASALISD